MTRVDLMWPAGLGALAAVWTLCLLANLVARPEARAKVRAWSVQIAVTAFLLFLVGLVVWPVLAAAGPIEEKKRLPADGVGSRRQTADLALPMQLRFDRGRDGEPAAFVGDAEVAVGMRDQGVEAA